MVNEMWESGAHTIVRLFPVFITFLCASFIPRYVFLFPVV